MKATVADAIAHQLKTTGRNGYTPLAMALAIQANPNTVRRTLREMVATGELVQVDGYYKRAVDVAVPEVVNA